MRPPSSLWRNHDFLKLWAGRTVSVFGTRLDALTYVAVISTAASPSQLGWLGALTGAPVLLVSLLAGAWVDRLRRRPLMIVVEIGRAALMATIPVAALMGRLSLQQVFVVGVLSGALGLLFDIADHAFFPTLVPSERLVEGNSRLEAGGEVAEIVAPAAGGGLVQALGAPMAAAADALTFLFSAGSLLLVRTREHEPARQGAQGSLWSEMGEGVRFLLGTPLLRSLTLSEATRSFCGGGFFGTLYTWFALKELHLVPVTVGILIGAGGLGGLLGAIVSGRAVRRFGPGPATIAAGLVEALAVPCTPLAGGAPTVVIAMMLAGQFVGDVFGAMRGINETSLRQALIPDRLLGRVAAGTRFLVGGALPLGALAAGYLATLITARHALLVAAAGMGLSNLWLILSPLRRLRAMPARIEA